MLELGRNCWRIERADRFALIVDAEDYFRLIKDALLHAQRTVYLIGWDFDTRISFEPEKTIEGPNQLGAFLRWLDVNRPAVEVFILKWDLGALLALGRGTTPLTVLNWLTSDRIHFRLDGAHPRGAAQHHKIAVIDDVLAFCGGIDMTSDRWDTRNHVDHDARRKRPNGRAYEPWHDATAAVDGDAARALGTLARMRWELATGDQLQPPPRIAPYWPDGLKPTFTNVNVAIARTAPLHEGTEPVREIEALYLDAIAAAGRTIYCESQYFASRRIAEAMATRLRQGDGPEILIINPESADGFLEAVAMDSARARLLKLVAEADRHNRFRMYTPVTSRRRPIYVHAKILIVDDRFLKVGSSNLNNRSMGFDTECDLAIDSLSDPATASECRQLIVMVRDDLLAEHLGTDASVVRDAVRAQGSVIAGIESLITNDVKSLVPYRPRELNAVESQLAENDLLDPEGPPSLLRRGVARLRRRSVFR